ncbi:MAG: hypothetical protein KDA88_23350 [Planctomycetaceae bacterium]|nr:hypothetical protein [Planctomycetaceae bacterium]
MTDSPPITLEWNMSKRETTGRKTIDSSAPIADGEWCMRPNAEKIPCPALLSFYNNGRLKPDKDGNVTTGHLDDVLASVGVSKMVRRVLVKGADKTDEIPQSFNLFELRGSSLDHSGSTGIRDQRVSPEKLESSLLRFSESGRMYVEHFAAAANQAQSQDPGFKGTMIQTVEFTALLEVFGRLDESKRRYLTVEDVRGLWIDGKYPKDWQPRPANDIGVGSVMAGVAVMAVKRLWKSIGF